MLKKQKLRLICSILALVLLVSVLAACNNGNGGGGGEKTVHRMTFSIGDPVTSSKAVYYQELAKRTLEATDGGLEITVHAGGTLLSHFEVREGVISKATDIGWFCTPFAPGQYPLSEVLQLPLSYGNQHASTYAYLRLFEQVPELQAELSEIKVLGLYTGPVNQLFTREPVTKPEDLKGMQVRTMSGVPSDCLTAWGASPVFIGATEIYEAMDKGVVQGFTFEWSGIASNTLYEVVNYEIALPFYTNPFIIMMNKESYENIPAEYKDIFDEIWASDKASFDYVDIFSKENEDSRTLGRGEHGIIEIIPDLDLFQVYADEYIANWVKSHTTSSFDAQAYLDLVNKLYAEGIELYPEG